MSGWSGDDTVEMVSVDGRLEVTSQGRYRTTYVHLKLGTPEHLK